MKIKAPVSQEFLRAFFNSLQIPDKVQKGYFSARLWWESKKTPVHLPLGSSSQVWEYRLSDGQPLALVHQYVSSSGQPIGKPDPKYISYGRFKFYLGQDP